MESTVQNERYIKKKVRDKMVGTIDIKPATKLRLALDESAFLVSIPLVDGKAYIPDENQKILFQYGAGEETQVLAGYVDDLFPG